MTGNGFSSVNPPYLVHPDKAENVDDPEPGKPYDEDNGGNDDADQVFFCDAAHQSVDNPDNIDTGKSEDNFHEKGQVVEAVDDILHDVSPLLFVEK